MGTKARGTSATIRHDPNRPPVTIPTCPDCGSTSHRCSTPDGRFHDAREQLVAEKCGCSACKAWLAPRTAPVQPSLDDLFAYEGDLFTHPA